MCLKRGVDEILDPSDEGLDGRVGATPHAEGAADCGGKLATY